MLRRAAVRTEVRSRGGRYAGSGLVLVLLRALRFRRLRKLGIGLELLDRLFGIALAHRLLEAAHRGAKVGSDGLELLGPEDQQDDDQDDEKFFESNRAHEALL